MTGWDDNWSKGFENGPVAHRLGGLKGFTRALVLSRHDPVICRPGLWDVSLACGYEVAKLLGIIGGTSIAAVQDDFGNLVAVAA